MINDVIKYETVEIRKREFFDFISTILEENGWINVTSNPSSEGMIYQSKGLDGKQNILINFWDGYDLDVRYKFTTTTHQYIDIRTLINYTPAIDAGNNGIAVPTHHYSHFTRLRFGIGEGSISPDYRLTIRYNCNANRLIMFISTRESTNILMIGKPSKMLSKEYDNTGNMHFSNYAYRYAPVLSWGVADRNPTGHQAHNALFVDTGKSIHKGNISMSEIGFGNNLEGIKGFLEGAYYLKMNTQHMNNKIMHEDKIIDEVGNEFTILYQRATDSGSYPSPFGACHIAICTKKAGE